MKRLEQTQQTLRRKASTKGILGAFGIDSVCSVIFLDGDHLRLKYPFRHEISLDYVSLHSSSTLVVVLFRHPHINSPLLDVKYRSYCYLSIFKSFFRCGNSLLSNGMNSQTKPGNGLKS
jgi:hypothetical protein